MKELTTIIEYILGEDSRIYDRQIHNDIHYTLYKEFNGSRNVVMKDYNTLSPFFNDLTEADNWINTNL